jgi:hypothetical protein
MRGPLPAAARRVDAPGALHLEVGVNAVDSHADQQMLADTHDLVDDVTGQVHCRVARHANIAGGQRLSG